MASPEQIRRQAEAARKKQALREAKKKPGKSPSVYIPQSPESRNVFHQIYPHQPRFFVWVLLPLLIATIGWTLWFIDKKNLGWLFWYAVGFTLFPVLVYLYNFIRESIEYTQYKNWRNTLGFPVNGWDRLGQTKDFPQWRHWDQLLIVTINLKAGTTADTIKLAEDILYLFTIAANQTFYAADFVQPGAAGDLRKEWKMTGPLSAAGSANSSVMGELYLCITQHLRGIQEENTCIEAVNLSYSNSMLEVRELQVSD